MTNSSEKLCLKWNEFQQNIVSYYHDLRRDMDFCDVTLVGEEGQQIEAHRIILTACSPFFSTFLKRNKHSHPMIYMRGVKAKHLVGVVDFIYHGEANICQEDLVRFLELAKELQLKGLEDAKEESLDTYQKQVKRAKQSKSLRTPLPEQEEYLYKPQAGEESDNTVEDYFNVPVDDFKLVLPLDTSKDDIKAQLDSMMVRTDDGETKFTCNVCGKASKSRYNMRDHIETHIKGLSYPCNQCDKDNR